MTTGRQADGTAGRPPPPQLGEVIDRMLDKGVVIQCHAPVSVLDIGLLGVSSRVSVMTAARSDLLAAILGVRQPRRRSKSPGRVRAPGRAQVSGMRPREPRCRLPAEVRPGIACLAWRPAAISGAMTPAERRWSTGAKFVLRPAAQRLLTG